MRGFRLSWARVWASANCPGANARAKKIAPAIESKTAGIAPHKISDAGQRRLRSVVGVQINWALPPGRPVRGNSGEALTALVAAVIRLSQKTSNALELAPA